MQTGVYLLATMPGWATNLPGWFTLGVVAAAAWSFRRGGGGTAISALEAANRVLEGRVHTLEEQGREKDKEIALLKGRTDVSLAMQPLLEVMTKHDLHAAERHDKTLLVLDLIAQRLGSETDHS